MPPSYQGVPGRVSSLSATGYADAATILTNWTLQTGGHQDLLVYPILFLFRHHVEVRLKEIISLAQSLRSREGSAPLSHDLMKLWGNVRQVAAKLRLPMGESWNYIERCIRELSEVDPTSEAFRYRTDRKGRDMVLAEPGSGGERRITHVNLRALGRTMARVVMWLDGVKTALEAMQDYIGETWGAC